MNHKKRPTIVTVVGWILVATGTYTLIFLPISLTNPLMKEMLESFGISPSTAIVLNLLSVGLHVTTGVAMLKRKRWGRYVYIYGMPVATILSMTVYNFKMLGTFAWGALVYVVYVILLTRKSVTEYFSDEITIVPEPVESTAQNAASPAVPINAESSLTGKKIGAIVLLIFGGLMLNSWLMMMKMLADHIGVLVIMSVIFGGISSAFIIPAIFMWGKKKWAIVLGILLASVGGLLCFTGGMLYQVTTVPEYKKLFAQVDPVMFDQMIEGSIQFGVGTVIIGGLLIYLQRVLNEERSPQS